MGCYHAQANPSTKLGGNWFCSFCVFCWVASKHTNADENATSLVEVINHCMLTLFSFVYLCHVFLEKCIIVGPCTHITPEEAAGRTEVASACAGEFFDLQLHYGKCTRFEDISLTLTWLRILISESDNWGLQVDTDKESVNNTINNNDNDNNRVTFHKICKMQAAICNMRSLASGQDFLQNLSGFFFHFNSIPQLKNSLTSLCGSF